MNRSTIVKFHAAVSTLSFLIIGSFFISTLIVELVGDIEAIKLVKRFIVYGIGLLVPVMAATGISGNKLAGKSRAKSIQLKKNRMKQIMVLGITLLLPAALGLNYLAQNNFIGPLFYGIQAIELVAGGTNIFLLGQNMKEGFKLSGRLSRKSKTASG